MWQWGYMRQNNGINVTFSDPVTKMLIDIDTKLNTNPNNIMYDGNSAAYWNTNLYCTYLMTLMTFNDK